MNEEIEKLTDEITKYTEDILKKNKSSIKNLVNKLLKHDELRISNIRKVLGKTIESSI